MQKKTFDGVTAIKLKLRLKGRGIVNYDSADQLWALRKMELYRGRVDSNYKLSKKNCKLLGQDAEGKDVYGFHHIISSDCLRHIIFDEIRPDNKLQFVPYLLYTAITSIPYLVRGYMFVGNHIPIKKKTLLCLTDAEEVGEYHRHIDAQLHSRAGNKNDALVGGDTETVVTLDEADEKASKEKKSTSLFYREHVGEIEYECEGFFDIKEAQFISADVLYDRDAVGMGLADNDANSISNRGMYLQSLNRNLGSEHRLAFYCLDSSLFGDEFGEQGICLTKDEVNEMVHYTLKKLLKLSYVVNGGYVEFAGLTIEVIQDGKSEPVVLELASEEDLSNLYFSYKDAYVEASEEKVLAHKAEAERLIAEYKKAEAAAKKEADEKRKNKSKKKAKKDE